MARGSSPSNIGLIDCDCRRRVELAVVGIGKADEGLIRRTEVRVGQVVAVAAKVAHTEHTLEAVIGRSTASDDQLETGEIARRQFEARCGATGHRADHFVLRACADEGVVVAVGVEGDVVRRRHLAHIDRIAAATVIDGDGALREVGRIEVADAQHGVVAEAGVDDNFLDLIELGDDIGVRDRTADTVGIAGDDDVAVGGEPGQAGGQCVGPGEDAIDFVLVVAVDDERVGAADPAVDNVAAVGDTPIDGVVAGAATDGVIAQPASDRVVAGAAEQRVRATEAGNGISATEAENEIGAGGAIVRLAYIGAVDGCESLCPEAQLLDIGKRVGAFRAGLIADGDGRASKRCVEY